MLKLRVIAALAAAVLAVGGAPGVASAATRGQANAKARAAADHYTSSRMGIGGGPWSASCSRRSSHWNCRVSMNGGECTGTLKLSYRLLAYAYDIGCME